MACRFPVEIICHFVSFSSTRDKYSCALVSKKWYSAIISQLYSHPSLGKENIIQFIKTICPEENASAKDHERAGLLSAMIRHLNLKEIGDDLSDKSIKQLLEQVRDNLVEFRAPPHQFTTNSKLALSKCTKLKFLDLKLFQNLFTYKKLFQIIRSFSALQILLLPVSFSTNQKIRSRNSRDVTLQLESWPPRLQAIQVECKFAPFSGVDDRLFWSYLPNAPRTLSKMQILYCASIPRKAIDYTLHKIGTQLTHLSIRLKELDPIVGRLDNTLRLCPSVVHFFIAEHFVSENLLNNLPIDHKLRCLSLEKGYQHILMITPAVILRALNKGRLLNLRRVNYTYEYTNEFDNKETRSDLKALLNKMNALEDKNPLNETCGIGKYHPNDYFYPGSNICENL